MASIELHTEGDLLFVREGAVSVSLRDVHTATPIIAVSENDECSMVRALNSSGEVVERPTRPLFFETREYQLFISFDAAFAAEHTVRFWHENSSLRKGVKSVGHGGNMLSGVLNFVNEVGYSDLVILVDDAEFLRITIEVFPSKLDYKEDYLELMADVTSEIYNLAFDLLRKTYHGFALTKNEQPSLLEFFAIIRTIYGDFCRATDAIVRQPHHVLQTTHQMLPAHKARTLDGASLKWFGAHPQNVMRQADGTFAANRTLAVKRQITYDTRENRFVVFALERVTRRLRAFRAECERALAGHKGAEECESLFKEIDLMIAGIRRRRNTTFLAEIQPESHAAASSLVFAMAPGYRELYACYLKMLRGLSVTSGTFNLSTKDLAELYEYWCFIKLNSLLKGKYELCGDGIVSADYAGISVRLKRGVQSKIAYENPANGEQIVLSYNPTYIESPTGNQRPDNVLSLKKSGSNARYEYVFDAKYRINQALPGSYYANCVDQNPGPEVDTINAMHRYRDAIVGHVDGRVERSMFGAYVLFPYKDENLYRNHRFYRSIAEVNIGGLPFLPSATGMVENLLDELIGDSPASAAERALPSEGVAGEEWDAALAQDWTRRDVLVGGLRSVKQFEACVAGCFYYVPEAALSVDDLPIHWVALYQSRNHFGTDRAGVRLYGEVIGCRHVKRGQIHEVPCSAEREEEPYWRFQVRNWQEFERPIAVREHGVSAALLTNEFLLMHAVEVPDLLIENAEEWRVYSELRRMAANVESAVQEDLNADMDGGLAYSLDDLDAEIYLANGMVTTSVAGSITYQAELTAFRSAPRREWQVLKAALGM